MDTLKHKSVDILDQDAPVLRKTAKEVAPEDIGTKKIDGVIERMKEALHAQEDGVAIAAPQIGESLRIFVVSGRALHMYRGEDKKLHHEEGSNAEEDLVFINPEIVRMSKRKKKMEEGCLSVRWLYGKVERSVKMVVRATDSKGKKFERGGEGLMAQIFQHEIDHLNGILFIDKAEDVENIPPESND